MHCRGIASVVKLGKSEARACGGAVIRNEEVRQRWRVVFIEPIPIALRVENKPSPAATVISTARLGGLHHRYSWREAA